MPIMWRALSAAAVDHHDGQRMALLRRNHVLHEHLAPGDGAVGHLLALDADPEAALIGQLQPVDSRLGCGSRQQLRSGRSPGKVRSSHGQEPAGKDCRASRSASLVAVVDTVEGSARGRRDCDDSFDQGRTRLRGDPREHRSVAVGHQDRRTDIVEQHRAARAPDVLRDGVVRHRLAHGRDGLRDSWIGMGRAEHARLAASNVGACAAKAPCTNG